VIFVVVVFSLFKGLAAWFAVWSPTISHFFFTLLSFFFPSFSFSFFSFSLGFVSINIVTQLILNYT
jgi:hypothetical protein